MAMTEAEVAAWLAAHGVADSVINDEAGYISEHYADPDEDPLKVLQASLGSYLQRTESGGTRDDGGYNTNFDDPAVVTDFGTTAARDDSPAVGYDPGDVAIQSGAITATTGSPVMTALVASNAPVIARTAAAVAAQTRPTTSQAQARTSTASPWNEGTGVLVGVEQAAAPSSPLVPIGLALVAAKLFGIF